MTDVDANALNRPDIAILTLSDLRIALARGWRDYRRAPVYGLAFSGFYVACGVGLSLLGADTFVWILVLSLGFPLVAPFAAVGLYEVSRRMETGAPLHWGPVLSVVWRERGRQTPWIGAVLIIIFLAWSFFAHYAMAIFLSQATITNDWTIFLTGGGLTILAIEVISGGIVALFVFAVTVVSLPLLLDREADFVTAMIVSGRAFKANQGVMLAWAATIAITLFVAMLPLFLGLLVALPVLGHATWHLYRRTIRWH